MVNIYIYALWKCVWIISGLSSLPWPSLIEVWGWVRLHTCVHIEYSVCTDYTMHLHTHAGRSPAWHWSILAVFNTCKTKPFLTSPPCLLVWRTPRKDTSLQFLIIIVVMILMMLMMMNMMMILIIMSTKTACQPIFEFASISLQWDPVC